MLHGSVTQFRCVSMHHSCFLTPATMIACSFISLFPKQQLFPNRSGVCWMSTTKSSKQYSYKTQHNTAVLFLDYISESCFYNHITNNPYSTVKHVCPLKMHFSVVLDLCTILKQPPAHQSPFFRSHLTKCFWLGFKKKKGH